MQEYQALNDLSANALKTAAFRQQMKAMHLRCHARKSKAFPAQAKRSFAMCSHETHGFSRGILGTFHGSYEPELQSKH